MATNYTTLQKGFKRLAILLFLLILSPILLTMSFKAIKVYSEGSTYILSIIFLIVSSLLILYTILYAFKTFKTFLKALFNND